VVARAIGASIQPVRILNDTLEVIIAMASVVGMSNSDDRVRVEYKTCIGLLKEGAVDSVDHPTKLQQDDGRPGAHGQVTGEVVVMHVTSKPFSDYKQLRDELLKFEAGVGLPFGQSYAKSRLGKIKLCSILPSLTFSVLDRFTVNNRPV
jgi:hypothetical protein